MIKKEKVEDKSLSPEKMTNGEKSAKIEIKKKYCFPDEGLTIEASSREEAEKKLKKIKE